MLAIDMYRAVMVVVEMVHRSSILEYHNEGDAS